MDDYGISNANTLEIPQSCIMYMELYTWIDKLMQRQCSHVLVTFLCFEASECNNMGSLSIFLADFFSTVFQHYMYLCIIYVPTKVPCPSTWSSGLDFIISFVLFQGLFDFFFAAELIL